MVVKLRFPLLTDSACLRVVLSHMVVKRIGKMPQSVVRLRVVLSHMVVKR